MMKLKLKLRLSSRNVSPRVLPVTDLSIRISEIDHFVVDEWACVSTVGPEPATCDFNVSNP